MGTPDVEAAACELLRKSVGLQPGENVLLVWNHERSLDDAHLLTRAIETLDAVPGLIVFPKPGAPHEEPPAHVSAALGATDVALLFTTVSIAYSQAIEEARRAGTRGLFCTPVTRDDFTTTLDVDIAELNRVTDGIATRMDTAEEARVVCPKGTDISFSVKDRKTMRVTGVARDPGVWNFLPGGCTATAPVEGSANGKIIISGSVAPLGKLDGHMELTVEGGMVVRCTGGPEAEQYATFLASFSDPNVFALAEVGIGTNPRIQLSGQLGQDERMMGQVHFGFGSNQRFGGHIEAAAHHDGMVLSPSMWIGGDQVINQGNILV